STPVKPARAAASKRSRNGASPNRNPRFAQKRGMVRLLSRGDRSLYPGSYARQTTAPRPRNETSDQWIIVTPAKALGQAHMLGWSYREPLPLSARLRGEREGPGAAAPGG